MDYNLDIRNKIGFLSFGDEKKNQLKDPSLFCADEVFGKIMAANLKALIIHGIGRNFSAGADLKFLDQEQNQNLKDDLKLGNDFLNRLERLNIPVVAAINGVCFGGGLELALACHMRIASKNSLFAFPEINYDLIPGLGGAARLFDICGNHSLGLLLSGDMIDAEKGKEMKLVDAIAVSDAVEESYKYLDSLVHNKDNRAIQAIMEVINTSRFASMEEALELETNLFCSLVEFNCKRMTESKELIQILENKSTVAKKWSNRTNDELMAFYFDDEEILSNRLKTRVDSLYIRILIKQQVLNKLGLDEQWVKEMRFVKTSSGKPLLRLSTKLQQVFDKSGYERLELSISHSRTHLAAIIALIGK